MKLYELSYNAASPITGLPDSQKIFGGICTVIKAVDGEGRLIEYLDSFRDEPMFVHSSMFIGGTMPMVMGNIFDIGYVNEQVKNQKPEEKLEALSKFKTFKKIKMMSEMVFDEYILSGRIDSLKEDILKTGKLEIKDGCLCFADEEMDIRSLSQSFYRARLDVISDDSREGRLFRDNAVYYPKETVFRILVKSSLEADAIEKYFRYFNYFALGGKGSVGRNLFELKDIRELGLSSSARIKMLLSKYVPRENEFDAGQSFYELITNNYVANPDNKGNIFTRKVSCFREGSYMHFNENREYYGQLISYMAGEGIQYHYGIGFVV